MDVEQAIRSRRSVRAFLPEPVADQTLREVFALAQLAPSNCNIQPWITHVVSGDGLKALGDRMVAASLQGTAPDPDFTADRKFPGVYRERQIGAAVELYGRMGVARHDREGRAAAYRRNLAFFDAPHAVFVFLWHEFEEREAVDLGIYAQTLMLALISRGIASCAQGALSLYPSIVRDHLGQDTDHRLIFGISFGYEDASAAANLARVGREDVVAAIRFHR